MSWRNTLAGGDIESQPLSPQFPQSPQLAGAVNCGDIGNIGDRGTDSKTTTYRRWLIRLPGRTFEVDCIPPEARAVVASEYPDALEIEPVLSTWPRAVGGVG